VSNAYAAMRGNRLFVDGSIRPNLVLNGPGHSVDWGGHAHFTFSEVVLEIDANPEHKRLLLLRRPPC